MSRPRTRPLPSVAELHAIYDYNPKTGDLVFKRRPSGGRNNAWNTRFAGKVAGTVMKLGYRMVHVSGQTMLAHRVAWAITHGEWPLGELDHHDGNKLNNRIRNLRDSTRAQNTWNRPGRSRTGLKGVKANVRKPNRWGAEIRVNGQVVWLGTYRSPAEAHAAYCGAARTYHGAFANLGMINIGTIAATVEILGMMA